MNTSALPKDPILKDDGLHAANSLGSSGELEVMRITKAVRSKNGELRYHGQPARAGSIARSIWVSFTTEGLPPSPEFDAETGTLHLYYPNRDHPEVQGLLNSKRNRFCYYWRSAQGDRTHAWLLSSR